MGGEAAQRTEPPVVVTPAGAKRAERPMVRVEVVGDEMVRSGDAAPAIARFSWTRRKSLRASGLTSATNGEASPGTCNEPSGKEDVGDRGRRVCGVVGNVGRAEASASLRG
mmetsp:Transcript_22681/g.65283  ORF Transcript_22681/g.65283 Transcript_22681/m.65283 type:complete len:111 (-) Transcript_22681:643-975(-)